MANFIEILFSKIISAILGMCAIDYNANLKEEHINQNTKIIAFELEYRNEHSLVLSTNQNNRTFILSKIEKTSPQSAIRKIKWSYDR